MNWQQFFIDQKPLNILYYNHVGVLERMPKELRLSLSSLQNYVISDSVGTWGYHSCSIDKNLIKIIYKSDSRLKLGSDKIYEKVCKECNGEICLNNKEKCDNNSECGSGTCNIAGVCGTEKIVQCEEGFKNCDNKSCTQVGIKKIGENYSCDFECKTNYGKEGICKVLIKEEISKFIFISVFLLVSVFISYLIWKDKNIIEIIDKLKSK